jgi:hypothetical protein
MIFISLGSNCTPAIIRKNIFDLSKDKGYLTCPFDLCETPYKSLLEIIENNFNNFFDNLECIIENNEKIITNYYNIKFNHESPINSKQLNYESDFYIKNNFKELILRYKKRIKNFYNYINNNNKIIFVTNNYNENLNEILNIFEKKYPTKNFYIFCFKEYSSNEINFFCKLGYLKIYFRRIIKMVKRKEKKIYHFSILDIKNNI